MTDLRDLDLLVVDCQTTGASPNHGRILELGWARYRAADPVPDGEIRADLVALTDEDDLPRRVARMTGITDAMLADAAPLEAVWRAFCDDAAGADRLGIHYAQFERRFLEDARERHGGPGSPFPILCTHAIARRLYPGLPRRGLRALAGFLGRPVEEPNRAGSHVRATAAIWQRLVAELRQRAGVATVDDLQDWLAAPPSGEAAPTYALDRDRRLDLPDRPGVYRLVGADERTLYVGKATSLKARVNQYFQTRKGLAEHKLELVSQVHDLQVRPTATPLEAALVEADRIKELDPPYNRALAGASRGVTQINPERYGICVTPGQPSVTVRDNRVLRALRQIGRMQGRDALPAFPPQMLYELGMHFWPRPDRDEEVELTPVDRLASLIRRAAATIRRGLWIGRLPGCALAWQPDGWEAESGSWRFLGFDGCTVDATATLADRDAAAERVDRWTGAPAPVADLADYDRLRVFTTELRRHVADGRPRVMETAGGTRFDRRALEACLELI